MSSSLLAYKSEATPLHLATPHGFLDLPAELRAEVYNLIQPSTTTIRLGLKENPHQLSAGLTQGLRRYPIGWNQLPHVHRPTLEESIHTSISLMKACHTTHDELAPRLYGILRFEASPASVANRFRESLHPLVRPVIQACRLVDHPYKRYYREPREKNEIEAVVKGFGALRVLQWDGLDTSADARTKGTVWKPHELRKLIAVLSGSAHLRKIFYKLPVQGWEDCGSVRITTINESPGPKEVELKPHDEYQKWLDKIQERKDKKKLHHGVEPLEADDPEDY